MGLIQFISEPTLFITLLLSLIFSLCFHEYSHGVVAYYLGDDTAYNYGRLTLNPMAHLDPMGTMLILFIGIFQIFFCMFLNSVYRNIFIEILIIIY